jgi:sugar O-acyltransferase (sialic acid O-acetyltransferase NeuD family)
MSPASPQPLLFLGAGGHARDLLDLVQDINAVAGPRYQIRGFLDDDPRLAGTRRADVPVLGPLAAVAAHPDAVFVSCLGSPSSYRRKESILQPLGLSRERYATLIHPTAFVSRYATIGQGCLLFPGVTVHGGAVLGDHLLLLSQVVVNHDCLVGDHTTLAASVNLAGGVRVGRRCYLGASCCLRGGLVVGDEALVGMGSVVLEDVLPGTVVAGNPARLLRAAPAAGSCQG